MQRSILYSRLYLMTAVLLLTGCGLARLTGPPPLPAEMNIPHYFIRDIVRDGAVTPAGTPLFVETEAGYGFEGNTFTLTGTHPTATGGEETGFVLLTFAIEDNQLVARIIDHNLPLNAEAVAGLNDSITTALQSFVADKFEEEILSYEDVAVRENSLIVVLVHTGRDGVVPLN